MEHKEGRFEGLGGLSLYHQCWLPDGAPKAVLLVAHGLAEHSGRYGNLVDYFVPKGYAICGLDHRGHGKSEGLRSYVDRFSDYVDDLKTYFDIVRGEHPDTKVFLVGHSLGGTIAVAYAIRYQEGLGGLIISAPGLKAGASITVLHELAARVLSILLPKSGVTVIPAYTISQDPAVVDAYVNDPLVYRGKVRARMGGELLRMIRELPQQISGITIPVLVMQGTADQLCDPGSSRVVYDGVGSTDKTLKLYEGFYHEVFNEPGRGQVLADVEAWLTERL